MNRLTLKITNKTSVKIDKKRYIGELRNLLTVRIEYASKTKSIDIQKYDAIISFENINNSITQICLPYFYSYHLNIGCIANQDTDMKKQKMVSIYIQTQISKECLENILHSVFELSLLIENSYALSVDDLTYSSIKKKIISQPLDGIIVNPYINKGVTDGNYLERNSKVIVLNLDNLKFAECMVYLPEKKLVGQEDLTEEMGVVSSGGAWTKIEPDNPLIEASNEMNNGMISLTPYTKRYLKDGDETTTLNNLLVVRIQHIDFSKIGVLNIDKVLDKQVQINQIQFNLLKKFPKELDYSLIHKKNGSRLFIQNKAIIPNKSTNGLSIIQLNYYQRILLGSEISSEVALKILSSYYDSDTSLELKQEVEEIEKITDEYNKKSRLKEILRKLKYEDTVLYPEFDTYGKLRKSHNPKEWMKAIWNWYVNKSVGEKTLELRCGRPYNVDEVSRIVRMSSDNISILGIDPTDSIIVSYNGRQTKARVLPFDIDNDWQEIQLTNLIGGEYDKAEVEAIVGLPACIRNELDIPDVNVNIYIKRDTHYIFHKNMNIQFLPLIALVFTMVDLYNSIWADVSIALKFTVPLLASLFMAFPVISIMLSAERAKVNAHKFRKDRM